MSAPMIAYQIWIHAYLSCRAWKVVGIVDGESCLQPVKEGMRRRKSRTETVQHGGRAHPDEEHDRPSPSPGLLAPEGSPYLDLPLAWDNELFGWNSLAVFHN